MSDRGEADKVEQFNFVGSVHCGEGGRKVQEECDISSSESGRQNFGYVAFVYYITTNDCQTILLVIVRDFNVEELKKFIEQTYSGTAEIYDKITGLQFIQSYLELDITAPVPDGWEITPHHEPMKLYKCDVDDFKSPNWPPHCQLSVYPDNTRNPVQRLKYKIPIVGVRQRFNNQVTVNLVVSHEFKSQAIQATGLLDETHLHDVLASLEKAQFTKNKWRNLGLSLGLKSNTLTIIQDNYPRDVDNCLSKTLAAWLKGVDERGGATWTALIDALESSTVDQKSAAKRIRDTLMKHKNTDEL